MSFYSRQQPQDIIFSYTKTQKPKKTDGPYFNVSHSGDLIIFAVSRNNEIGADIEYIRSKSKNDILVKRFCSPVEYQCINSLPREQRWHEFIKLWVIKEAYLKATGKGIAGIENIEVIMKEKGMPTLRLKRTKKILREWKVFLFEPAAKYIACVVYKHATN